MLSHAHIKLLKYIHTYGAINSGACPSFNEMAAIMGYKSRSNIHRMVCGLEERGFIRRLKHRARAIEIVRMP